MQDPYHSRETMRYRNPIASRELILDVLKKSKKPMTFAEIAKKTKTQKKRNDALTKRLNAMLRDEEIVLIDKKYAPSRPKAQHTGSILRAKDGLVYVIQKDEQLLEVAPMDANLFLPFDEVRYRVLRYQGKVYAQITHIDKRHYTSLLGLIEQHGHYQYFVSFIKGLPRMRLAEGVNHPPMSILRAEVWVEARIWHARITECLGNCLDPDMPERIAEHVHFPEPSEAPPLSTPHETPRTDWRDKALVTIDGPSARDFDDAVMAEAAEDGTFIIHVAIADVTHYVPVGSPMDLHAYERCTSVYFPKRCIPMLPEVLSNDLCSLRPHEPRHAMGVSMRIDADGKILEGSIQRVLITSKARFTYEEVEEMLTDVRTPPPWFAGSLKAMKQVTHILNVASVKRRALSIPPKQEQLLFDDSGHWQEQSLQPAYDAHILIEKIMVLTNHFVAKFLQEHEAEAVYRHHPEARPEGIEALLRELKNANIDTEAGCDLFALNEHIRGHANYPWLAPWVIRAMSQARYETEYPEHHGLSLDAYVHFTSPIRRYPDVMVHRSVCAILDQKASPLAPCPTEDAARRCSRLERRADTAVYDALDLYQCQWVYQHLGSVALGALSTSMSFGAFVKLEQSGVEVLLPGAHLESLGYAFDPEASRWTHPHQPPLMLGSRVEVKLAGCSFGLRRRDAYLLYHLTD